MSLQNHLSISVPRTLRKAYAALEVQTPWLYGVQNRDFQIADLAPILATRAKVKPGYGQLKRALLRETDKISIRSLSGFARRRHHVPDHVSSSTRGFVESISKQEVDEHSDAVFNAIRENMNYKRLDLSYESGSIITPDFEYGVWCMQDDSDPEMALLCEELTNIKPSIVVDDRFNLVFKDRFSELVFEFPKSLSISNMIDAVEDSSRDDIQISYPKDIASCELKFKNSDVKVRIKGRELIVTARSACTPRDLIEAFFVSQQLLAGTPISSMLTS